MFRHVVLLGFREDTPDEAVDEIIAALCCLPARIPELRSYVVGRDAGLAPDNATVAVVADFDDEAGYLVYRDHPDHVDVITRLIRPRLAGRSAVQHAVAAP
ncbi:MAG: Dabb family protein [Microthrixaceae bacterium]